MGISALPHMRNYVPKNRIIFRVVHSKELSFFYTDTFHSMHIAGISKDQSSNASLHYLVNINIPNQTIMALLQIYLSEVIL